ncbi:MAG: hypothetical protein WCF04_07675 [Candidatus Nanopelagicales bacterium]
MSWYAVPWSSTVKGDAGELPWPDGTFKYVPWGGNSPVNRLFAKVAGPMGGDLRLVGGIKPEHA